MTVQQHPEDTPPNQGSVSRSNVNQSRREILEYWTKQRMAEAKPRELRLPEEGPRPKQGGADAGTTQPGPADQD